MSGLCLKLLLLLTVLPVAVGEELYACYREKWPLCGCNGNRAECVLTYQHKFVPKLPKAITDLTMVGIERIDNADFFSNVTHITSLSFKGHGDLSYIAPGVLDILENLTSLQLAANSFKSLPEATFSKETRQRLLKVEASGNPFICHCDLMWFGEWMRSSPSVFANSINPYICIMDKNEQKSIKTLHMDKQACLLGTDDLAGIIIWSSIFLFTFMILIAAFTFLSANCKNQALHQITLTYRLCKPEPAGVHLRYKQFKYDVFIAYAEDDKDVVFNHLLPKLEGRLKLKLCLHQRDFRPGRNIVDNIEDSVENSKRIMLIFSTHFARSPWCQFELSLCQRHAMDRSDELVVIHVKNTPECQLTPSMKAILRTCTYIPWPERGQGRAMFWNSLQLALGDVIRAPRQRQERRPQMEEAQIV